MIIDTHTHFYDPERPQGVPWPEPDSTLYRTVLPKHFRAVAAEAGVTGTVVVEASVWLEDNQWILDLASDEPSIVGFIGNLDLRDPDFRNNLDRFSAYPKFRGIRARGFDIETLLQSPEFEGLEYVSRKGLTIELMVNPEHLELTCELVKRLPELSIVVDHIAHVSIDGKSPDPVWTEGMERLAGYSNVFCKLSRITEAAIEWPAPTDPGFYRPVIDVLWNTFGHKRILWGSNWPVTELASDYATTLAIVTDFLKQVSREERENVLWRTSQRAYRWSLV